MTHKLDFPHTPILRLRARKLRAPGTIQCDIPWIDFRAIVEYLCTHADAAMRFGTRIYKIIH
jgi:hypothetical protein